MPNKPTEDNTEALKMEATLLRSAFKQELTDLRFQDIEFKGSSNQLITDLEDKECLAYAIGATMDLPDAEVTQMVHAHEESLSYNDNKTGFIRNILKSHKPIFDKDPTK